MSDTVEMTDCLKTARSALEQQLITERDYDQVKTAFLRAQQIRAGLDAGFIRQDDYDQIKQTFLQSLQGMPPGPDAYSQPSSLQQDGFTKMEDHTAASAQPQASNTGRQTNRTPSFSAGAPPSTSATPAPAQGPSATGTAHIPANIPKMGGSRPKQPTGTSMSGIAVNEDAVNLYYYMKAKSVYRWALWKLNDDGNEVVIAGAGNKDSPLSELLDSLPSNDCRYGVYDYQFVNSDGCVFNKLIFVNWAPDVARIKAKMMYASTKDFFKGYLDGLSIELQANDLDDITEDAICDAVKSVITRQ